ncbi:response regulator [Nonomuraea cavernae]|uniref:Response regulator n=1 Tax=Nonomuraea cavernae TaxID=2045107 RepID=A0A918DGQ2_9ACTN|nr:response regulator [Nonomuraea cavernae]MCA2185275.1 response regulator [Nonomuraea cavernae]GGO65967.1 response regulator [Nonomuraea cavernae]
MNRQVKILLVDDKEESLIALDAVLRPLQQRLFKARSGQDAMKLMLRHDFAVVLLDVLMPGMDGFETASHIKRLDQTRDVPIIFLTGTDSGSGAAFRGYAVGAVDYITKPFDPWVLRSKVTVFIELFRKNAVLQEQAALLCDLVQNDTVLSRDSRALADFADRLSAVEARLAGLAGTSSGDEGLRDTIKDLAAEVAAMRAAFDTVRL